MVNLFTMWNTLSKYNKNFIIISEDQIYGNAVKKKEHGFESKPCSNLNKPKKELIPFVLFLIIC